MANEQIEEITPGGGGGGNPMIPAIAVLVLMPVLSFVLTKFLFIPQIQGAVKTALIEATGGNVEFESGSAEHGASGEAGASDAHGGGGEAKSGGGGAHGGGGEAAGGAEVAGPSGNTYEFDSIIANLSGSSMNRYVKVSFIIEGSSNEFAGIIDSNRVKLIDATITVLSSLTSLDLQNPGIKNQVRSKLIAAYDAVLKKRMVEGLYFSEFVVQ